MINKEILNQKKLSELRDLAKSLGSTGISKFKKDELIELILSQISANDQINSLEEKSSPEENQIEEIENEQSSTERQSQEKGAGILEVHPDGFGFLRANRFEAGEDDTYVSPVQIRRFNLKTGDYLEGILGSKRQTDKFQPLIYVNKVNGDIPDVARSRKQFEDLTPIYPDEKLKLEEGSKDFSMRLIDLISPIGKGQRGLIVSPPKVGKTTLIKSIANAVVKSHPEIYMIVLLIDERPEEVTDIERSVTGERVEIVASTFDELPSNHVWLSEFVLERAKRLVEHGKDVVILLDSITRLTRAYNVTLPSSGRTLSGGLDPTALHKPKRFFGAARNIEDGGSLTILSTALIDTGSRMDDVIYEEFKGTGNMEIHLNRDLSNVRIFPAIDLYKSGTRREELLQENDELEAMIKIRRALSKQNSVDIAQNILSTLSKTSSNKNFVDIVIKNDI